MNDLLQINSLTNSNSTISTPMKQTSPQILLQTTFTHIKKPERTTNNASAPATPTPAIINHNNSTSNKRPSSVSSIEVSTNTSKRIKSETQSSPQLLQQLMAPSPTPHRSRSKINKLDGRWNLENSQQTMADLPQQSSSNSVLMNLLVSGCDVSAGYVCFVPMRPKKSAKV